MKKAEKKVVSYEVYFFSNGRVERVPTLANAKALTYQLTEWSILKGNAAIGCEENGELWNFSTMGFDADASKQLLQAFKKSRKEVTDDDAKNATKKLMKNPPIDPALVW